MTKQLDHGRTGPAPLIGTTVEVTYTDGSTESKWFLFRRNAMKHHDQIWYGKEMRQWWG